MIPYKHTCTSDILLCLFLYIPVVWFAMVLGQSFEESGLPVLLQNLTVALNNPLDIHWTKNSPAALLFATGIYGLCMGLYFTDRAKRRDGEEHGSATWGSPQQVNAMFVQRQNKPLTRHVKLGLDARKHKRNLNVLVIGGSGASKTRGYVKPNILEANTNYVITDPKQEVLTATGGFLRKQGYDVRVLNLVNLEQSDGYNPFVYLRDDKDVLRLVNTLIQATTPKGSHENDPFWTKSETALLMAIILMLFHEAPAYEQNFAMVMRTLEFAEVSEEDEEHISPLDMLFRALEQEQPNHIAVRQYRIFKQAAGKTAKSILVAAEVSDFTAHLSPQTKSGAVTAAALSCLGTAYSAMDCSELTQYAYGQAGISLPRTSVEQTKYCYNNGYAISRSQLQPGDLIFWSKTTCDCGRLNEIHHVGVYVGAGKIVDASSAKGYVVLRDLWSNSIWQIVLYARSQG